MSRAEEATGCSQTKTWKPMRQVLRHPPPPPDNRVPPGFDVRDVVRGEKPSRMKIAELRARLELEQRELERLEAELRGDSAPHRDRE